MKKITNVHSIDLPIAVWLLQDGYDSGADEAPPGELISVTSLIQPTRRQILQRQVDYEQEEMDISDLLASRMGHALHDSIERAWKEGDWRRAMKRLHYPQSVIDKVKINPDPSTLGEDDIAVHLEQRRFKEVGGIVLSGKQDFVINGAYRDFKSTSVFSYLSDSKNEDYILQGSLYRYIMPEIIWQDKMRILFLFTDWQKFRAKDPNYPQCRSAVKEFPLLSMEETEEWVLNKIDEIKKNAKHIKNQDKMIRCTDKELWKNPDEYRYFVNPETAKKGGRPQKAFKKLADAQEYLKEKGKGVIGTVKGEVKACTYCSAFPVCEQRKEYFPDE